MPPYVVIPIFTALVYAFAALVLRRAMQNSLGPWRVTFVANLMMAVGYLPLLALQGPPVTWGCVGAAVATGLSFFVGQIFTFLALEMGDVSVATPVMGTKVMLVALFTIQLLHEHVAAGWWVAAFLTTVATGLLGRSGKANGRNHALTIVTAFLSSASFAYTDVSCQKWVPMYGLGRFVPMLFGFVGVISFSLVPFFRGSLRRLPGDTWRWLLLGSFLLAVQSLGMAYAIGTFGHATVVNIVYSSRGMWSVVLVWLVGHWFQNTERAEQGHTIMATRFAGSGLILAAIWIVVHR